MRYYNEVITATLARKCSEKGIPLRFADNPDAYSPNDMVKCITTFADIIDYLMGEKNIYISINPIFGFVACNGYTYDIVLNESKTLTVLRGGGGDWVSTAMEAIERALKLC